MKSFPGYVFQSLVVAVLSLTLVACVTVGAKFDMDKVGQLQPGVSTISDAIQLLGPAKAESTMHDNSKLLQWQYAQGTPVGGSGAHVAILFDPSGRMVRVTHKSKT